MNSRILPPYRGSVTLTDSEKELIACALTGDRYAPKCALPENWREQPLDDEDLWPDGCKLRASLIRSLVTGAPWTDDGRPLPVDPKGLWIENVYIADILDLHGCEILVPLWMKNCVFAKGIRLRDAVTRTIGFNGSRVGMTPTSESFASLSIDAVRMRVSGKLHLAEEFLALGEVNLASARIAGQMECKNGHFNAGGRDHTKNTQPVALRCDAITVEDGVLLTDGFTATAKVDFEGARISSSFDCSGATLDNRGGVALNCAAMRVGVDLKLGHKRSSRTAGLTNPFRARGLVDLSGAKVESQLTCVGGEFHCTDIHACGRDKVALLADGIEVGGNADMTDLRTHGIVRFRGARISGYFRWVRATCEGPSSSDPQATQFFALQCSGITVEDDVWLNDGYFGDGGVSFRRATISGSLLCRGATFCNEGDPPYHAAFSALDLANARIKAGLDFTQVKEFRGVLDLTQTEVRTLHDDGSLWLPSELRDSGHLQDSLNSRAKQPHATDNQFPKRVLKRYLNQQRRSERKELGREHPLRSCVMRLDGFTYQRFIHPRLGEEKCSEILIAWVKCQDTRSKSQDFKPQPWQQLARVMRDMGHVEFARRIAIAFRLMDARRYYGEGRFKLIRRMRILKAFLLNRLIGFGYKPLRLLRMTAYSILAGWIVFATAGNYGYMAPREDAMVAHFADQEHAKAASDEGIPGYYPHFNAFVYAVDVFIPVLELGQETSWEPSLVAGGRPLDPPSNPLYKWTRMALGQNVHWSNQNHVCGKTACTASFFEFGWHRVLYWIEVVAGWIVVSLFVTGIGGIMKKD